MRAFIGGFVLALVLVAVAGAVIVMTGVVPARQDQPPSKMERWAANKSLAATMHREMPLPPYPFPTPDEAGFVKGATLYVQNCAICHGTAHGTPTAIAPSSSRSRRKRSARSTPRRPPTWACRSG